MIRPEIKKFIEAFRKDDNYVVNTEHGEPLLKSRNAKFERIKLTLETIWTGKQSFIYLNKTEVQLVKDLISDYEDKIKKQWEEEQKEKIKQLSSFYE